MSPSHLRKLAIGLVIFITFLAISAYFFPPSWVPKSIKPLYYEILGEQAYRNPPANLRIDYEKFSSEPFCFDVIEPAWRKEQTIEGVKIAESRLCSPDNPFEIAAFVKGTNNVSMATLMRSDLALDTVTKGADLDNDGDPDEIHIRLEVVELNGFSPDTGGLTNIFSIAPGIQPGFWVFAPKSRGMATENFESNVSNALLRMPSPTIRVEQGDRVKLTLENTHYMPHTLHLHGVDHPFVQADGKGNDGVPQTSESLLMPGKSRTYTLQPRQAGTMAYHCHVQTGTHLLMGLVGMFVIEENRPNNWVQTFNVGAGQVRHSSVPIRNEFDREYDLHYLNADKSLHSIIQNSNDPRQVAKVMNREYSLTGQDHVSEYFLLNGRSFPYTLRESLIVVKPDESIKIRVFNAGEHVLSLHTHGHKPTITHYDGVKLNSANHVTRDVFMVGPAQRSDLLLSTVNDGLHSYGAGIWLFHDHNEIGITTDGMMPGGDISAIVYESWLTDIGMPKSLGMDLKPYFTKQYYQGELPVWALSDNDEN